MKIKFFGVLLLVFLTIVSGVVDSYAAEARATAAITIIIPDIPQQQENAQVLTAEEKNAEEEKVLEELRLASAQSGNDSRKN